MNGLGTIVNGIAIIIEGIIELFCKNLFQERYQEIIMKATGILVVF
ncbi:DUF554 family protein [Allocoprobacillus halotolerans]|uniref:DUF554 family protein n=1 Tax=Allocoprobacillus halotolerans TaxID=2944914 RepID=A0ABY5I4A9_9FIRM|nr:DUF554 family protein [Allocoprobacillus halotolerans]UTY39224.1 DUF554 family protein [Allocoprobacillus halotolerans]